MKFIKKWVFRLLILNVLWIGGLSLLEDKIQGKEYMEIEVQSGDSIWSIAAEWSPQSKYETNAMVNWIAENNFVRNNMIYPGDTLVIPVEEKKIEVATEF